MQFAIIILFASSVFGYTGSYGGNGDYDVYGHDGFGKYDTFEYALYRTYSLYNIDYHARHADPVAPLGYLGYTVNSIKSSLPPIYGGRKLLTNDGSYGYGYNGEDDNKGQDDDNNDDNNHDNNDDDSGNDPDDENKDDGLNIPYDSPSSPVNTPFPPQPAKNTGNYTGVSSMFIVIIAFALVCVL